MHQNTSGNSIFDAAIFSGQQHVQSWICCRDFQPHMQKQQALGHGHMYFFRSDWYSMLHPYLSLMSEKKGNNLLADFYWSRLQSSSCLMVC
jgi:hypothetical protein